jgi:hypothetical protein
VSYTLQFKNQTVDPVGKSPINVAVGTVNTTSTSLALTGKGAANFGKFQQENLLRLLECFADTAAPTNPTVGQLWYDSANLTLKVLTDASPQTWKSLGGVQVTGAGTPPVPAALGDLWFERTGTASGYLYVFTGIGRYPTTSTTIGGWDQIWPQVEIFGGREEYDLVRQLVDQICGTSVSAFGSGAIGRSIQNLTDFGALDLDLRAKFKALGADANILFSPNTGVNVDREISRQAVSSTLFYFNDSSSSADGKISGPTADPFVTSVPGTIYVDGVLTTAPAAGLAHNFQVDDAYIIWDRTGTLVSANPGSGTYFVARQQDSGQWEYDDNTAWVAFTPLANMYVVGTISTYQADNNTVYPVDRAAFMWVHAVPLIGTKYEHLKVEPNSQDWDTLLAAAKYALNRLEIPFSFTGAIASMPFVGDGRAPHPTLIGLNSQSDPRFPSAARRSNRRSSAIRQVQSFSETANALNVAIANRFSIQGINGFTGTFPYFKGTSTVAVHNTTPISRSFTSGNGYIYTKFRFASMEDMNRFLGSGGAVQFEITHTGGAQAGDSNFRTLLSSAGTWRLTADRTRIFGQSLPLTITQPTSQLGIWNGNTTGMLIGSVTIASTVLSFYVWRISNRVFDIQMVVAGSAMSGTTAMTVSTISDNETYLNPGTTDVYPKPNAWANTDSF